MNVLLVDDEDYVLDFLEEQVPWASLGDITVYKASSAEEALEIAGQAELQMVVTDIRMPETSGLELLAALRQDYPDIKVVLLSGYSEFEYARKALQHGAADYLLKPVTEEEVVACLQKVIALIDEEKRHSDNLSAASDMLKLGISRMREHLLLDLLLGKKYGTDELQRHLHALQLSLEPDEECALALIRIETGTEEATREDFELFSYGLLNMAEEIFSGKISEVPSLWSCKDSYRFVIILLPVRLFGEPNRLHLLMTELQQAVQHYLKRPVSMMITRAFPYRHELHRQYLQALNAFGRFIGTRSGVVRLMTEDETEEELKPLVQLHQSPTIQQLMETGRWEDVTRKLELILDELNNPSYQSQQHLMEAVYYLFSSFSYIAHKQGDSFADLVDHPSLQPESYFFKSIHSIRDWALTLIEQFKRSLQEATPNRNHIIRQIHEYIALHLHEDVSLTRVSEHVYLHPVYLSRLYKKETGESLSTYISRVRMEKAAELLMTTNKKVSDIAKEVGYQKTQYFIHIFKENYQLTPQSYRNR
ncbi:response regulator [Paenibacillus harenae]|uniref:Two-component system response regulator YesN n=1 Tax=Paenibacillus harenae TaxID=306543 RepID=A0ABT9TXR5_PAEHA|nr:response regulator [Paenibacillus harenae]MDQ0112155.1 two-component system response regulator YesN [Paenibacillus harenae]